MTNTTNRRKATILAAAATLIAGTCWVGIAPATQAAPATQSLTVSSEVAPAPITIDDYDTAYLPACEFEDSEDCYWDASVQGNGEGVSFIDWDGKTWYNDECTDMAIPNPCVPDSNN